MRVSTEQHSSTYDVVQITICPIIASVYTVTVANNARGCLTRCCSSVGMVRAKGQILAFRNLLKLTLPRQRLLPSPKGKREFNRTRGLLSLSLSLFFPFSILFSSLSFPSHDLHLQASIIQNTAVELTPEA